MEKVAYASGKVYINTHRYFGKLPEELWEFKAGGYQVCEKWLKDRKSRVLSSEDITHYQRMVVALKKTNVHSVNVNSLMSPMLPACP